MKKGQEPGGEIKGKEGFPTQRVVPLAQSLNHLLQLLTEPGLCYRLRAEVKRVALA